MHSLLLAILSRDVFDQPETSIREIFFLGLIVNYLLWGVQLTQSYHYYKSYRKTDAVWVKAAVGLLCVVEAAQSICTTVSGWRFLIRGLGDLPGPEQHFGWGGDIIPFLDAFTASMVHVFYAQKIWKLLKPPYQYICTGTVLVLSCLQLTAGLGCSVFMFSINITVPEFPRFKTWACIWLMTSAVTDFIITMVMSWKLSQSRTGIKQTDDVLSKLIRTIVETGLATAIVQIVDIVIYLILPLKSYHVVPALIGPKVYSNSMLALLNSRKRPRTTSMVWSTRQSLPAEGIRIRTSRIGLNDDGNLTTPSSPQPPSSVKSSAPSYNKESV